MNVYLSRHLAHFTDSQKPEMIDRESLEESNRTIHTEKLNHSSNEGMASSIVYNS